MFGRLTPQLLSSTYNLSSSVITSFPLLQLLSRPPKFIPTPEVCNHRKAFNGIVEFIRKIQWHASFSNSRSSVCRFGHICSSRWAPPGRVPPHIHALCQTILSAARSILFTDHRCFRSNNLPSDERSCLQSLISNDDVVIRPADKGGRWVILNAESYNHECSHQLGNEAFYRRLPSSLPDNEGVLTNILNSLHMSGHINRKELRFLSPPLNPRDRRFYVLPKLHKCTWPSLEMPPGRPIISDINSWSGHSSKFIEFHLFPLAKSLPSFLRDSQHLIAILRRFSLPANFILCTFDVKSLYTNIPINEGIRRVAMAFSRFPDQNRPDERILQLLKFSLERNDFCFNSDRFMQTSGVAMGKAYGGSFANIYMGVWEDQALASFSLRPSLWVRFQDDVFVVWPHGPESLSEFHLHLNHVDPNIQLELSSDPDSIHFLDLHISRPLTGHRLCHRTAFKESVCHRLLPKESHHAPHVFRSVIFSQVLRWATRSSTRRDFEDTTQTVFPHWKSQGASRTELKKAKRRVLTLAGFLLDWRPGFRQCDGPRCGACTYSKPLSFFNGASQFDLFPVMYNLSCDTTHCIYVIECRRCLVRYVGQTSAPLRQRISQHLRNIRDRIPSSPLVPHFADVHSVSDLSFFAIDRCFSTNHRLSKEYKWIKVLRTGRPLGLNSVIAPFSNTVNLVTLHSDCTARLNNFVKHACQQASNINVRLAYTTDRNLLSFLR